jgi:hypothetical protein
MIAEVNTRYLKEPDKLKVRVLRAKSKLVEMGFFEVMTLFRSVYPNYLTSNQLHALMYCKYASIDFTTKLEALVDKLSQE